MSPGGAPAAAPRAGPDASETRAWLRAALDPARVAAAKAALQRLFDEATRSDRLLILGSAALPRRILSAIQAEGGRVAALIEYAPRFWGQSIAGVPVLPVDEALARSGPDPVVIVGIWSPGHSFAASRRWLASRGIRHILPPMAAFWRWGERIGPHYQLAGPEPLLQSAARILAVHDALADAESRAHYAGVIAARLTFDPATLPRPDPLAIYFDRTLLRLPEDAVLVDAGAYRGDTLEGFLRWHGPRFDRYLAFEPDPISAAALREMVAALPPDIGRRIAITEAALGAAPGRLRLTPTGTPGTRPDAAGSTEVPLLAVDDVLAGGRLDALKLDTEGAEAAVLAGAARSISRHRPALLVSIYHHPTDVFTLAETAMTLLPEAALFVRAHDEDGIDLVLYAIPRRLQP
ncbi:MAG: FkbM family methyltransferase [Rhodovarius sp.]|nr:FkbM family methyltransferase [Rhodovarius sp.]